MRLADLVYAFPSLLFFIVVQLSLGQTRIGDMLNGLVLLLGALSILSWTGIARLVRGEVLSLKELEFVIAARALGGRRRRVVWRHVLPNALGPVVVAAAFIAPQAIVAEAILGYLGIGVRPDVRLAAPLPSSWGTMIFDGYQAWRSQPWMLIAPSLAVALTTLACTFVGDGLGMRSTRTRTGGETFAPPAPAPGLTRTVLPAMMQILRPRRSPVGVLHVERRVPAPTRWAAHPPEFVCWEGD